MQSQGHNGGAEGHPHITVVTEIVDAGGTSSSCPDSITNSSQVEGTESKRTESKRRQSPVPEEPSFDGLTRRQLLNLAVLALTDFMGAVLLTNQNPWFPLQVSNGC
jgi:hypothetical protein